MAETVEVLNAKVVVDASSVTQAQSQFNAAIDSMSSKSRGSFAQMAAQIDRDMSQKFKALEADVGKAEKEIGKLSATTRSTAESTRSFGQQVRSASLEIGTAAATIAGPVMLAIEAFSAMQDAAQFRGMAQATRNMANSFGVDMAKLSSALDKAANGTLDAQTKFRMMNEAMLAGGADVAEKLPQLVEIARAAAVASGADFETVFQKLLLGIARGSAKLIDDARIYLRVGGVVEQYAKSMGIATEEVDEQTRKQLVLNAVLEDGARVVAAVGKDALAQTDSFKQMNVAAGAFMTTMKQLPTIIGLVNGLTTAINAATQAMVVQASWSKGAEAQYMAFMSGATLAESKRAEELARNEELRRLLPAMGIVPTGAQDEQTRLEESRLNRFGQQVEQSNDDILKKQQSARDKMNEIIISSGDKMRDSEQGWMQDVIDLNIDHQRRLAEIALDGARKRQDIELDFARKIEDADLEYQRAVEDAQFQSASRRAEIEQRYQEKLYQIQRRFQDAYWNAVKTRDAVALVEAVRDRDRSIEDATRQRDQDIMNEDAQEQQRVQNAALAHQRKLEDAQRYYQRAMQDQRIAQQRAIEDENLEHQYKEIELRRHFDWRLQEIDAAMNQELATAQVKYGQAEADYSAHLARMAAIASAYMGQLGIGGASGGGGYTNPRTRRRAAGGVDLVNGPTPFLAGEGGPELVLTVPMGGSSQMLPAPMSHSVSGNVNHQVDMIAAQGMRGMEARIIAATMQALREVYRR